ncbi:MAG TPA: hypothetical protein PLV45_17555, partial [bacterium]|nr:hypothetical protein [bacterium]
MTTFLKRFLLLILVVSSLFAVARAQVNGEQFTVDGATVVHVWGSHTEMGHAHGYLLSEDIMRIVREYMFTVISPDDYTNFLLPVFRMWMAIPVGYQQELDGMLQGMQDAGTSIYVDELQRDLTSEDLAVMNSIVDFWVFIDHNPGYDLACSSTCGWGDGTSGDPDTPRGTLHCRDMDWTDTATYLLGKSSLILAYEPSDAGEQSWISIAYPGYIGCLSGMNESGTGATLDLGNYVETPGSTSGNVPICMQVRAAIEGIDPNGDGFHNAEDVWDELSGQSRIPSTIVHAFGKALGPDALDPPALVVESNHTGIARRDPSHEPDLAPWFIAATNHHRKLYAPVSC